MMKGGAGSGNFGHGGRPGEIGGSSGGGGDPGSQGERAGRAENKARREKAIGRTVSEVSNNDMAEEILDSFGGESVSQRDIKSYLSENYADSILETLEGRGIGGDDIDRAISAVVNEATGRLHRKIRIATRS